MTLFNTIQNTTKILLCICSLTLLGQNNIHSEKGIRSEDQLSDNQSKTQLVLDLKDTGIKIQPTMYGIFFEDINFAADGGLYAEMIKNRSFEFLLPKMGWLEPNSSKHSHNEESGILTPVRYEVESPNQRFAKVQIKGPKYELINEGFRGMGIKENQSYNLTFEAKKIKGKFNRITFQFIDKDHNDLGHATVKIKGHKWQEYQAQIVAKKTESHAKLKITFDNTGEVHMDMISLFPEKTWKGRSKGLRKDLVELLAGLNPGFLRFPGGCIVEGRTLERRYQWKKTVGPIKDREILVNRWNTEFMHKHTPDYFQSFGLGFFEYFQLSEDLGAAPLPILSCGIACQFNTGELVPLNNLDPYVQDALDLIEFANGSITTEWGAVRAQMGHPEPFNLKYIGIGNEQWGEAYIERYKVFHKAIKEHYPEITIVSGSGPFPDGDYFEYGWEQLKLLEAEIVDEHYYRSPEWFLNNANRYDSYDRSGPKVFAGEYAAHPPNTEDGPKENNWSAALAEAAFMTGLERNADVVTLTSYAPLMAHNEAYQWAPDLIWFNNLEAYGTLNYLIQSLYSNNAGTDVVKILENNAPLTGQHQLYASAVTDSQKNIVIVKLVNTAKTTQQISIKVNDTKVSNQGGYTSYSNQNLSAYNTYENATNYISKKSILAVNASTIDLDLEPNSFSILTLKLKQ